MALLAVGARFKIVFCDTRPEWVGNEGVITGNAGGYEGLDTGDKLHQYCGTLDIHQNNDPEWRDTVYMSWEVVGLTLPPDYVAEREEELVL